MKLHLFPPSLSPSLLSFPFLPSSPLPHPGFMHVSLKRNLGQLSKMELWHQFQLKLLDSMTYLARRKMSWPQSDAQGTTQCPNTGGYCHFCYPRISHLGYGCHSRSTLVSCRTCQLHVDGLGTTGWLRGCKPMIRHPNCTQNSNIMYYLECWSYWQPLFQWMVKAVCRK